MVKKEPDALHPDPLALTLSTPRSLRWAISWSDLMMTLFILFVCLYVYASARRDLDFGKGAGVEAVEETGGGVVAQSPRLSDDYRARNQTLSDIYEESVRLVKDAYREKIADVKMVSDSAVRIILTGDLLFKTGQAELRGPAVETLINVAEMLRGTPWVINVAGHTDNTPIHSDRFPTNWELSATRACRVARFLIEEMKLPSDRFLITGHAYHQPLRPNTTRGNRMLNRRVEIVIMKDRPGGEGAGYHPVFQEMYRRDAARVVE